MKRVVFLALCASLLGVACEEKKSTSDAPRTDAGTATDKYATADPKLERALRAVASASSSPSDGPPPSGIFAPGEADRRHARGVAAKIEVIAQGDQPLTALAPAANDARPSSYGAAALEVVSQLGPRTGIAVDYALQLGPAKKDEGGPDWLVADVRKALPSKALGAVAPAMEKDIGSLEGSQLRIQLGTDGRESDLATVPGKASKPDLEPLPRSATEALLLSIVALPPKPVGVGGQWIAETRMPFSGLDVVAYRAYRVKGIEGDRVHLTLDVKAYAASKEVQLSGVPKGATLEQFDGVCQGDLDLVRGEVLARKSNIQERVVMVFSAPGAPPPNANDHGQPSSPPGNMLTAQIQTQAALVRGEDLRAASRP
jgi:hypothetical protein